MLTWHGKFPFVLVVMMGDNIYGSDRPQDFVQEVRGALQGAARRRASSSTHRSATTTRREQRFYKFFNMDGKLYYSFKAPKEDVRFFALESTYMDPDQLDVARGGARRSRARTGRSCSSTIRSTRRRRTHGSQVKLRAMLEPLFIKYNVSLVLNGHDHVYERIKPQNGIQYFVEGSSGQLRDGDLRKGLAADRARATTPTRRSC